MDCLIAGSSLAGEEGAGQVIATTSARAPGVSSRFLKKQPLVPALMLGSNLCGLKGRGTELGEAYCEQSDTVHRNKAQLEKWVNWSCLDAQAGLRVFEGWEALGSELCWMLVLRCLSRWSM